MIVKTKTTTTYTIEMTQEQAQALMSVALADDDKIKLDVIDPAIDRTLDDLRQSLLSAGMTGTLSQ